MKKNLIVSNKNPNIKMVKSSLAIFAATCFLFIFSTGLMISEAVSLQKFSRLNTSLDKDISLLNQKIVSQSLNVYKEGKNKGYAIKTKSDKIFVERSLDSKYTYLFR